MEDQKQPEQSSDQPNPQPTPSEIRELYPQQEVRQDGLEFSPQHNKIKIILEYPDKTGKITREVFRGATYLLLVDRVLVKPASVKNEQPQIAVMTDAATNFNNRAGIVDTLEKFKYGLYNPENE